MNQSATHEAQSLATELGDAVKVAIEAISASVERARTLVRDAVGRLLASFTTLHGVVREQQVLLASIAEKLHTSGNANGLAGSTIQLVRQFVEQVVRVSHESMRIIDQLHETGEHVDTIVTHADRIDGLARETRFIALNARIETQRAGDAGRTFKVVAEEVKRLAGASSELSVQIRREVSAAHESLRMTHRTAETMAGHDMAGAIESRGAIIGAIEKLSEVNVALDSTLAIVCDRLDEAIRALQFEDMVSQLLTDSLTRLRNLSSLTREGVLLVQAQGEDDLRLSAVCHEIRLLARASSVNQESLAEGGVELF